MPKQRPKRKSLWSSVKQKDELAARVAKLRLVDGLSVEETCEIAGLDHGTQVSRLVQYARKRKFIRIVSQSLVDDPAPPPLDLAAGRDLRKAFGLAEAFVARIHSYDEDASDDSLHEELGRLAAQELGPVLRMGRPRCLAVGGGRGPWYFCHYLNMNPFNLPSPTIYALSGAVRTKPWDPERQSQLVDARDAANLLANAVDAKYRNTHPLNVPLVCSPPLRKHLLKNQASFMNEQNWASQIDFAFVGIGALRGKHRLFNAEQDDPELRLISDQLSELQQLSRDINESAALWPCGDVCNYLFYVDTRLNGLSSDDSEKMNRIKELVEEIDEYLFVATIDDLRQVNTLVAIAGGERKHDAIYAVLTDSMGYHPRKESEPATSSEKPFIDMLFTDKATADALIARHQRESEQTNGNT